MEKKLWKKFQQIDDSKRAFDREVRAIKLLESQTV